MISETYFKILDDAHRELSARFERLEKARANRDAEGIKRAEMDYFHALQQVYAAVENAIAEQGARK